MTAGQSSFIGTSPAGASRTSPRVIGPARFPSSSNRSLRAAFGTTQQEVTIAGSQERTLASGATATSVGGVLALPSNIGTRHNFKFTQVPEINLKAVWPIGNQLTLSAGFTALYWNRVVRAADQIELVDVSPEALRRRMAHGNIYPPEKVDTALGHYFRAGNLTALRELALLWVADRVDQDLAAYRVRHGIRGCSAQVWLARQPPRQVLDIGE